MVRRNQFAVVGGEVQAVLAHQRDHVEAEIDPERGQDASPISGSPIW
jgi:hypothetical protein